VKKPSLCFRSIEIRRMPGFGRGELELSGLCPGVNVIYGPNASGKTTLSRAIGRLLRPADGPHGHESLRASLEVRGSAIEMDYDSGRVRCFRRADGATIDCPKLAPPEIGGRHVLALQDLIRSERDEDLAAEIVKELAGGYDVAGAKSQRGYRDRPSGRGKLSRQLQRAQKEVQEAVRRQDQLLEQEAGLGRLEEERRQAQAAQEEIALLEKAIECVAARREWEEIRLELKGFPPQVARVTEDDVQRLARMKKSLAAARSQRDEEQRKRDEARDALAESGLSEEGVPDGVVTTLRLKSRRLMSLDDDVRHKRETVAVAEAELEQARLKLGPEVDPQRAQRLDAATVEEFFRFARRAEKCRAEKEVAQRLRQWLGAEQQPADPEALHEAVVLLHRWLGVGQVGAEPESKAATQFVVAGVVLIVFGLAMAITVHPSWLFLLLIAGGMIAWTFRPQSAEVADRREELRREFEGLGLAKPAAWAASEVHTHVRSLQKLHDEATLARERQARWSGLQERIQEWTHRQELIDQQRRQWADRLGLGGQTDEASLAVLAGNIYQVQRAEHRLAAAEAAVQTARQEYERTFGETVEALEPFGFEPAKDADQVGSQVDLLDRQDQLHREATRCLRDTAAALATLCGEIEQTEEEMEAFFDRLEISAEEEYRLHDWVRRREEYDRVADRLRMARHQAETAEAMLADRPELVDLAEVDLVERRRHSQRVAARLDEINRRIGAIENAVETARGGSDLETRLAWQDQCGEDLRALRADDYDAVAGGMLADFLMQQEQADLPGVLRRAKALFARVTHGRYELHVHQADPPEFRAFDTARLEGLSLDQLSSGTRLQLLLAVRVAFVEQQEEGVKVPLLLDETLGNSDERRAKEIIDAVIEICRQGRQVFYFTAQHDEVGKWQSLLEGHDEVPSRLVDLAEVRGFSETERVPPMTYQRPEPEPVPAPEGLDWAGYGRRLKVPPLDPFGTSGDVHLWYLVEDVEVLYRLLAGGINKWGQLKTLVTYGQAESVGPESRVYREAEAAARALEEIVKAWRIGRGRPIDRDVLEASGAVSANYIDRLADLAEHYHGDARSLLDEIEAGGVRGFRTEKRETLRDYLAAEGHLAQEEVLSVEEIQERVRPIVFADFDRGLLRPGRLEQLIDLVAMGGRRREQ